MKPGIVLSSFTRNAPSSRRKKSTRAIASHRHASNAAHRQRAHLGGLRVGRAARARAARPCRPRTCRRSRRSRRPGTTSPGTDASRRVVAEHADLDLAADDRLLGDDPLVVTRARARSRRRAPRASRAFDTPTDEPMFDGLHEAREPELGLDPVGERRRVVRCRATRGSAPAASPAAANARFIMILSMPTAEPSTPAPTYGQAGQLEQALHRAVLAVRAVQQRQHDVDRERRARAERHELGAAGSDGSSTGEPADRERGRQRVARALELRDRVVGQQPATVGRDRDRARRRTSRDRAPARPRPRSRATRRARPTARRTAAARAGARAPSTATTWSTARIPRPMMNRPPSP